MENRCRIFHANLINAGILPLIATVEAQPALASADQVSLDFDAVQSDAPVKVDIGEQSFRLTHQLTARDCETLRLGGLLARLSGQHASRTRQTSGKQVT
ncbi:hypothetical protein [Marivita geojedonensis]|uniref:Uncharacterized protein n=1 Tax=Marivita geojedonensis TaxID=1123756 RepID=A0A1X4NKV0_9RHOB|nr:hypothetical protein [Marivita geojedonensis]OSQ50916.1 hypothetical protein MGEO_10815 [Marivita geojedonensis]